MGDTSARQLPVLFGVSIDDGPIRYFTGWRSRTIGATPNDVSAWFQRYLIGEAQLSSITTRKTPLDEHTVLWELNHKEGKQIGQFLVLYKSAHRTELAAIVASHILENGFGGLAEAVDIEEELDQILQHFCNWLPGYLGEPVDVYVNMVDRTLEMRRPAQDIAPKSGGRPGLTHEEVIHRLAKTQEAQELRDSRPGMTWAQACAEIDWCPQRDTSRVKLLQQAGVERLKRADADLLAEVAAYREKMKKEKKKIA